MSWMKRTIIGIVIVFIVLVAIGYIIEHTEKPSQKELHQTTQKITHTTPSALCPVTNTSTSFCIVKDGKPYYFAIEGWELPTREEVENMLLTISSGSPYGKGELFTWLKVRTNIDIDYLRTAAYVQIGEIYRPSPILSAEQPIKRGEDVLLIPYRVSTAREDMEALLKAKTLRLVFNAWYYSDVLPIDDCVGGFCFTLGQGINAVEFYVNYSPPPVSLKVLDVKGGCNDKSVCIYNVTFELRGGHVVLRFLYNLSTSRKSEADFPIDLIVYVEKNGKLVPTDERFPLTVVPPLPPSAYDVWKEPEHDYIGTVIPPSNFTLRIKGNCAPMPLPFIYGNTTYIGTPWGGVKIESKVKIKVDDVNATVEDGELIVYGVRVTIENHGKTPIVIPYREEAYTREIPLFVGRIGSEKVLFGVREEDIDGVACTGDVFHDYPGLIINPGERVEVNLVPAVFKGTLDNKIILPLSSINGTVILELVYNPTGEAVKYSFLVTR